MRSFIFDLLDYTYEIVIITLMAVLIVDGLSDEHTKKGCMECLTTKYDKFECYSMIYGDK